MNQIRVLSYICDGRLGSRPDLPQTIRRALEQDIDIISAQGNGMDAGPQFLGSGETPPPQKAALEPAILGALKAKIPFVLSLGGRAGADSHVEPYLRVVDEIARDAGKTIRVAFVRGELDKEYIRQRVAQGEKIPRLFPTPRLSEFLTAGDVDNAVRIQAQMGPEPIKEALSLYEKGEVDGVLTGRALDVGVHMAYPLLKGFPRGGAAHMAKVIECAGLCGSPATPFTPVIADLFADGSFVVRPSQPELYRCTPESVSSHGLYERENPFVERNPGGTLDVSNAVYEAVEGDSAVRVSGAVWQDVPYSVKLEGVRSLGYETITPAIVKDPDYILSIDRAISEVTDEVREQFSSAAGMNPHAIAIVVHVLGRDALPGGPVATSPGEIVLWIRAVAPDPQQSYDLCNTVRIRLNAYNFPNRKTTAMNLAFPLSKVCIPVGQAYVFNIWHLLPLADPCEPFPVRVLEFPR